MVNRVGTTRYCHISDQGTLFVVTVLRGHLPLTLIWRSDPASTLSLYIIREQCKRLRNPSGVFWYPVPRKIPGTVLIVLKLLAHAFLVQFNGEEPAFERVYPQAAFSPFIHRTSTGTQCKGEGEWVGNLVRHSRSLYLKQVRLDLFRMLMGIIS